MLDREGNTNAVDQLVIETLPALLGWKKKRTSDKWSEALQNAVLTFSDLQIVTGISLAVSGYSQVHCQLTAYDAELIIDLVWFSSITHLATLTSLRRYFRERPALKIWRMVCTGITVGMLSYALISTGYDVELPPASDSASDLPSTWLLAYPAWCFLHLHELDNAVKAYSQAGQTGYVTYNSPYIALIMTFLVVSFVTRTIRLFPTASDKIRTVFRTKPSQALKNKLARLKHRVRCAKTNSDRRFRRLSYKSLLSIYCLVESTFEVYTSSSWEVRTESPLMTSVLAKRLLDHMVSCGPRLGNYTCAARSFGRHFRGSRTAKCLGFWPGRCVVPAHPTTVRICGDGIW